MANVTVRRRCDSARADWETAAYAQYINADAVCRGNLLSRRGLAAVASAWPALWTGREDVARKRASEELNNYWDGHLRVTLTAWRAGILAARQAEQDQAEAEWLDMQRKESTMIGGLGTVARAVRYHEGSDQRTTADGWQRWRAQEASAKDRVQRAQVALRDAAATAPAPKRERDAPSGADLLDYTRMFYAKYAVWPSDWAMDAAALYAMQAHAHDAEGVPAWLCSPHLMFTAPGGGFGKSWMAGLVAKIAPSGAALIEPTKASLIDMIAEHNTVVINEADELFATPGRNRGILAVTNACYEPDHYHTRQRGGKTQKIHLYGPVILDGLDSLIKATRPDLRTMASRCIVIQVRQAPKGYRKPQWDRNARALAGVLRDHCAAWMAEQVAAEIADAVPELPEGVGNRAADLWQPLIATADAAGGRWPEAAREACEGLTASDGVPDADADQLDELMANL